MPEVMKICSLMILGLRQEPLILSHLFLRGVVLWNGLADDLKNCENILQFKRMFKKQVMKKYLEERVILMLSTVWMPLGELV